MPRRGKKERECSMNKSKGYCSQDNDCGYGFERGQRLGRKENFRKDCWSESNGLRCRRDRNYFSVMDALAQEKEI